MPWVWVSHKQVDFHGCLCKPPENRKVFALPKKDIGPAKWRCCPLATNAKLGVPEIGFLQSSHVEAW